MSEEAASPLEGRLVSTNSLTTAVAPPHSALHLDCLASLCLLFVRTIASKRNGQRMRRLLPLDLPIWR